MSQPAPFDLEPGLAEELTGGTWHGVRNRVTLHGAAIDSRRVREGNLFACFRGAQVDGHDFAATAAGAGAALILATRPLDVGVPVLEVADVTAALGSLAAEFRARHDGIWIGVTGSNGKTTVKELLGAACAGAGEVHFTRGNFNNQLGLPLTILDTPAAARVVVVELGASAQGEIARLAAIARPTIGVITTIGPAHLEGFGGIEGVATGKSELFRATPRVGRMLFCRHGLGEACAAYGATEERILAIVRAAAEHGRLTVVGDPGCPIDGESRSHGVLLRTPVGEVALQLMGAHNLANACLAWHAAVAAGGEPRPALGRLGGVPPTPRRPPPRPPSPPRHSHSLSPPSAKGPTGPSKRSWIRSLGLDCSGGRSTRGCQGGSARLRWSPVVRTGTAAR
jgi:UDP-N-acetylmuramoyl-tripeptide--D-alanyl-D-alanine ligase